jgi:anti-anti-sigma factor
MDIAVSQHGTWTLLALTGKVDETGAAELRAALAPHLGGGKLALDCTAVEYVTSQGFRVLLQALKEQHAKGGRLLVGNLRPIVRKFFDVAGLVPVFKLVPDVRAVMQAEP